MEAHEDSDDDTSAIMSDGQDEGEARVKEKTDRYSSIKKIGSEVDVNATSLSRLLFG